MLLRVDGKTSGVHGRGTRRGHSTTTRRMGVSGEDLKCNRNPKLSPPQKEVKGRGDTVENFLREGGETKKNGL